MSVVDALHLMLEFGIFILAFLTLIVEMIKGHKK